MRTIRVTDRVHAALREAAKRYKMAPAYILETILQVPISLFPASGDGSVRVAEKNSECRWCGRPFKQLVTQRFRYCELHRDAKLRVKSPAPAKSTQKMPLPMRHFKREDALV